MLIVFGSINLDIATPVARMPTPGETLLGRDVLVSPGGKGANQAHAAQRFGVPTRLFGSVGDDTFAECALACLRAAGVDLEGVKRRVGRVTGIATIASLPGGENAIVVASGANEASTASQIPESLLRSARVLLLQMETDLKQSALLARRARALGVKVIMNASPLPPAGALPLADIDVLIVNQLELAQLATRHCVMRASAATLASALAAELDIDIVTTMGAAGSILATPYCQPYINAALPVEVVDTTGAGDTFAGVFSAATAQSMSRANALRAASIAAGLACTRRGAQLAQPDRAAIFAYLDAGALSAEEHV